MQNVMHIATNAGHTVQNDGQTMPNDGRMLAATHLMFARDQRGGLRAPYPYTLKNFSVWK